MVEEVPHASRVGRCFSFNISLRDLYELEVQVQRLLVVSDAYILKCKTNCSDSANDPRLMTTRLDLLPGTHHVKFIVDGDMQLSDDLPTAVDYTNILVNYIEVSADDIPHEDLDDHAPQGLHPPLVHPPGVEQHDFAPHAPPDDTKEHTDTERKYISTTAVHYSDVIPQYLPDLDRDESSNRFRRSANRINDIPAPPTLPMFLGKSILNGTTPMKDDSSVLNMPNHTVLNHLATCSIKNHVLATSLTTRYKRKVSCISTQYRGANRVV